MLLLQCRTRSNTNRILSSHSYISQSLIATLSVKMNLFRIQYIKTQTIMRKLFAKQRMRGQSRNSIGAIRSHGKCIEDLRCDQRSVVIPSFPRSENNTIDNSGAAIKQVWHSTAGILRPRCALNCDIRHPVHLTLINETLGATTLIGRTAASPIRKFNDK